MPRYVLEPVDLEHPDWQASTHKHRCRVTAPDEHMAREFANAAFRIATQRSPDLSMPIGPWPNEERVKVTATTGDGLRASFPPLVEVPDFANSSGNLDDWDDLEDIADFDTGSPWKDYPRSEYLEQAVSLLERNGYEVTNTGQYAGARSVDGDNIVATPTSMNTMPNSVPLGGEPSAGTAPEFVGGGVSDDQREVGVWGKSKWGEAVWGGDETESERRDAIVEAGTAQVEIQGYKPEVVATSKQVQHVIQNRVTIINQSAVLLDFLHGLEEGPKGNEGHIDLWLDDQNDEELKELLRQVRDELTAFNDLLRNTKIEEQAVAETGIRFKDAANKFLLKFGETGGTRTGELFAGTVATTLMYAGYLDPTIAALIFGGKAAGEVAKKLKE